MITGSVNSAREAVVSLNIMSRSGRRYSVQAIVDTGFTDYLTLPPGDIEALNLPHKGGTHITLADEVACTVPLYAAEVEWKGQALRVPVLGMAGVPLLGMAMLEGSNLHVHVIEGGAVQIS